MSITPPSTSRPRPVLLYGIVGAAVAAFVGGASAVHLIPASAVAVVGFTWAVIGAGWAVYVQSVTTPTAAPQDDRGVPLVPVDSVPPVPPPPTTPTRGPVTGPGLTWTGPNPRPDA